MKKHIPYILAAGFSVFCVSCATTNIEKTQTEKSAETIKTNYLLIVNKENKIDEHFADTIELVETKDVEGGTIQIEKKTFEAYQNLKNALEKEGIIIGIDSCYRSIDEQKRIQNYFLQKYGEEYTRAIVAEPGTSEHHTGFAIDIVPFVDGKWIVENDDMIALPELFEKIHKILPEYGFILRFMEDKVDVTGYAYEPWHIRFVGEPKIAQEITQSHLALEEFVK